MIISRKLTTSLGLLLAVSAAGLLSGCQNHDSGADIVPTVTIKPSTGGEVAASDEEEDAGDSETDSGAAPASSGGGGGTGSLIGKVVLASAVESLPPLYPAGAEIKDPSVCAAQAIPNERIVTGSSGGLANVFIYLDKAPQGAVIPAVPSDAAIFDQKGCVFLPHALVIRSGQTVHVLNDDPISHNTHSVPVRNSAFNQIVNPGDRKGVEMKYTKPEKEPVFVKCDIHPWMAAYHLPLDHPFAAVTDANGNFEIPDLPAGAHTFKIWQEAGGLLERAYKVEISGGTPTEVTITVEADKLASYAGERPKVVSISR
ncbi:MAG: carboxypeptidase regulatory-like domain-containing protein [Planctomycetaceae bacterium]